MHGMLSMLTDIITIPIILNIKFDLFKQRMRGREYECYSYSGVHVTVGVDLTLTRNQQAAQIKAVPKPFKRAECK